MSTIIKVLKKLDNSSTSISRQPDAHNIKMVIKSRNEKYKRNFKMNYIIAIIIIVFLAIFIFKILPDKKKHINEKEVIKKQVIQEDIKKDHYIDRINKKKLNSDIYVKQIKQKQSLYKKKKVIKVEKKRVEAKPVKWHVAFQLTGILKYGAQNKRKACINNRWVKEGDIINGIKIKKIGPNSIMIQKGNQTRVLSLH